MVCIYFFVTCLLINSPKTDAYLKPIERIREAKQFKHYHIKKHNNKMTNFAHKHIKLINVSVLDKL